MRAGRCSVHPAWYQCFLETNCIRMVMFSYFTHQCDTVYLSKKQVSLPQCDCYSVHMSTHTHTHTHTHARMHMHTHTQAHAHIHTYTHTCTCTHTHKHTHTYTHTHTHTHTCRHTHKQPKSGYLFLTTVIPNR